VLTRNPDWHAEGAEVARTGEEALALAGDVPEVAVIGGADVFELFLHRAGRIELTEVHAAPEGEAIVPVFDPLAWRETAREDFPEEAGRPAYSYVTLERMR
jgi:dihydrofolate reductase